ncbi:hypothetical protein H8D91_00375 [archaeon]|nr:hypothetical protein [archaeon]
MKKSQKKKIYSITVTITVLLAITGILIYSLLNNPNKEKELTEKMLDDFTKCLTEKNVIMYGSIKNANSLAQMKMFESSLENLNYIDCSERKNDCMDILILPSWEIKNQIIHGAVSLEVLSKLTECEL